MAIGYHCPRPGAKANGIVVNPGKAATVTYQAGDRLVVLANGRVAAAGTLAEVVGDTTAAEVRTPSWEAAFTALEVGWYGGGTRRGTPTGGHREGDRPS